MKSGLIFPCGAIHIGNHVARSRQPFSVRDNLSVPWGVRGVSRREAPRRPHIPCAWNAWCCQCRYSHFNISPTSLARCVEIPGGLLSYTLTRTVRLADGLTWVRRLSRSKTVVVLCRRVWRAYDRLDITEYLTQALQSVDSLNTALDLRILNGPAYR
jgi:hypothetical protein